MGRKELMMNCLPPELVFLASVIIGSSDSFLGLSLEAARDGLVNSDPMVWYVQGKIPSKANYLIQYKERVSNINGVGLYKDVVVWT